MSESQDVVPPTPQEILEAALTYARAGLKIYPVDIRGLKPDGKKDVYVPVPWKARSSDDLHQVRHWWADEFPGYGIGVDMEKSRLAVADADVKDGVDGIARLEAEVLRRDGWSAVSRTPSDGVHVWYRDPDGRMGSGANIFGTKEAPSGVDGRGVGGTIFMPPTFVPGYGQYTWPDGIPDFESLPDVPAKLVAACPPGGKAKSTQYDAPEYAAVRSAAQGPFMTSTQGAAASGTHADRTMTIEQAQARLMPLWETVRDTRSPNGLWQAVAAFARAAAHYQCFWDRAAIERMVLHAYAEGGHGYTELDSGDVRAISSAYAMQAQARALGDLDDGWEAVPEPATLEQAIAETAATPEGLDAVEALLAEMKKPAELVDRPPQPYLVKSLLNLNSVSWLIGAPGSRKSFVALDMAGHVARGLPWQGLKVRQGRVVLIVAEGAGGIGGRMKAWELEHGPMGEEVFVLLRPIQTSNAAAWAVLVEACRRIGPALVVVDTQARVTVGMEENSAKDMGVFVDAVSAIQRVTGACVMPIHHTGRNGGDARGSSALDGAQDTELKVVANTEPLRGELRVEKQKDLAEREPIKLAFKVHFVGVDEDGDKVTSLAVAGADAFLAAETAPEEAEPWEAGHADVIVQLFKVLRDQGRKGGLTKAEARTAIVERFYGGQPKALNKSTFYTGWDRAQEKVSGGGDPVMVRTGGARWTVDEDALASMPAKVQG